MILGAEIEHDWVNSLQEAERIKLLEDAPAFDPRETPAYREVGTLAEMFRRREGTLVTDNPCGRFGAHGPRARELLEGAPWHDYYGPNSPLERLCKGGSKILRLGADLDSTTALHLAEYRANVANKRRVRRHYRCMSVDGAVTRVVECLDDSNGIVDWPGEDYFATILRDYLATGRAGRDLVGQAQSELIEAEDFVAFGAEWMTQRFNASQTP
jgi:aminoglycoside N3'-acetyltransferase